MERQHPGGRKGNFRISEEGVDVLLRMEGSISTIKLMLKPFHRICKILFLHQQNIIQLQIRSNNYERKKSEILK